jgi:hypothetical protein
MDWLGSFGLFQGEVKLFESACLPQTQHVQELPARDLKSQHQRGECAGLELGALGKFSRLTSQNSLVQLLPIVGSSERGDRMVCDVCRVFRRGYCKRIVVKPARRKGYLPCNVKVSTVKRGPATGRADRGANSGVGREGASLDPGKRTHTPELRTTAPGPGSPMSATCKGTRGFMAKRKAVVPNTLGDDILDRLRTCTNRPQQVKAA